MEVLEGTSVKTLAVVEGSSCGGCNPVLYLEALEGLLEGYRVLLWKAAGLRDADASEELDLLLILGSFNSEGRERLKELAERSKEVVVVGTCATSGGIRGLSVFLGRRVFPATELVRNSLFEEVPGCPPEPELVRYAIEGTLSEKGVSREPVCSECKRERRAFRIYSIKKYYEAEPSERACFLSLGVVCLGPVTVKGCGASCPKAGQPCRGCYGPLPGLYSAPLRMISSVLSATLPSRLEEVTKELKDPFGTFWRFSAATEPVLRRKTS